MLQRNINVNIDEKELREPLLGQKTDTRTHAQHLIALDTLEKLAQKKRSESTLKWWVLLDVFFSWTTACVLIWCVAPLETTLLREFEWDSSYFSYIVSCTYMGAILGPFCLPFFASMKKRFNLCTLLNNQITMAVGQTMFALLCIVYRPESSNSAAFIFVMMCVARFIIGIGMGATDALSQATIAFWFGESPDINVAFAVLIMGIESSNVGSRIAFKPFANGGSISLPFFLALFMSGISISINLYVGRKIKLSKVIHPEYFAADTDGDENSRADDAAAVSTTQVIRGFSASIWFAIGVVSFITVIINVLYGCFVDPLHEIFHFTEYDADMLLCACALSVIILGFPAAILMERVGAPLYWLLAAVTLMTVSMGLLAIAAVLDFHLGGLNITSMQAIGVIGIVGFSVSLPFAPVKFTLQAMVSPPQHVELVASISTTIWWLLSVIVTNSFGWIRDSEIQNYAYAVFLMFFILCLSLVFAVLLWIVDKQNNGSLITWNHKNNNDTGTDTDTTAFGAV